MPRKNPIENLLSSDRLYAFIPSAILALVLAAAGPVEGASPSSVPPGEPVVERPDPAQAQMPVLGSNLEYDNGTTDPNTDSGNEISQWVHADDFELTAGATIDGAEIDWFELTAGNWDGGIEWFIFDDSGGLPGTLLDQGTGTELSSTPIGNQNGWSWFTTLFKFDHGVLLASATRYWFAVHWSGVGDYIRDDVYWAYSQQQNFNTSAESELGTFDNWLMPTVEDRAFRLFSNTVLAEIFADGFESGDTLAWSASVP